MELCIKVTNIPRAAQVVKLLAIYLVQRDRSDQAVCSCAGGFLRIIKIRLRLLLATKIRSDINNDIGIACLELRLTFLMRKHISHKCTGMHNNKNSQIIELK